MKPTVLALAIAAILFQGGCVTTGSSPSSANTNTNTQEQKATVSNEFQRPKCAYNLKNGYSYYRNFYQESKREAHIGDTIKEGSVLFYGQYLEVQKSAVASALIENRDRSPLSPNWAWGPEAEEQVVGLVSTDTGWWYLINVSIKNTLLNNLNNGFWTSSPEGMLCGNNISVSQGGTNPAPKGQLETYSGMSDVYQSSPLKFLDRPKAGVQPISVSASIVSVSGAAAMVEINVMKSGRAIHTERVNVDLIGGEFSAVGINFSTERKDGQTVLKSVTVPEQLTLWLARLGVK